MPERTSETIAPASGPSPVTTTDLLKVAGLAFVLVDHYGLFFDEGQPWWRVFGRVAAPVFFFLIGYATTRRIPLSWLVMGAALTALDVVASDGGRADFSLNILLSFALLRLILPLIELWVMPHPTRLILLLAATLLLIHPVGNLLEYGMEGWLWAYFGLAQRLARESSSDPAGERVSRANPQARWDRPGGRAASLGNGPALRGLGCGILAAFTYLVTETRDLDLMPAQAAVLAPLLATLLVVLLLFRRGVSAWQPGALIARPIRFAGRHSFGIYAGSLALMQIGGAIQDRLAG